MREDYYEETTRVLSGTGIYRVSTNRSWQKKIGKKAVLGGAAAVGLALLSTAAELLTGVSANKVQNHVDGVKNAGKHNW